MNKTIKELLNAIQGSIERINAAMPAVQRKMSKEIELMLKDIELDSTGRIKPSVNNIKLIAKIKGKLETLFRESGYTQSVSKYLNAFNEITELQNKYFKEVEKKFKPKPLLQEIRNQSIQSTIDSLTGAGINANVTKVLTDVLQRNVTTGANYTDLLSQVRDRLTNSETGDGLLQRYAKQVTTDALNQYAAQYINAVSNDLGLKWHMYTGALIETSRDLCEACVKKRYIHIAELPDIIKGDFKEFKDLGGKIGKTTGLPLGMVPDTTPENFHVYRGGYNCNHQFIPVPESMVPVAVRIAVYKKHGIKYDENGFAVKGKTPVEKKGDSTGTTVIGVLAFTKGVESLKKTSAKSFRSEFEKLVSSKDIEKSYTDKKTKRSIYIPNNRKVSNDELEAAKRANAGDYEVIFTNKGQFKRGEPNFDNYLVLGRRIFEADIKTNKTGTVSSIQHNFESGNEQAKNILIDFRTKIDKKTMIKGVEEGFSDASNIDYVHAFYKGKNAILSRKKILNGNYSEFEDLYK